MDPTSESQSTNDLANLCPRSLYMNQCTDYEYTLSDEVLAIRGPQRQQAVDQIRTLYTRGVPFFTKSAIADLASQFERATRQFQDEGTPGKGEMFSLQGLDGKIMEIENDLGAIWTEGMETENVLVELVFGYKTYQQLITANRDHEDYSPKLALCPLRVYYLVREIDTDTHQLLHEPSYSPLDTTRQALRSEVDIWEKSGQSNTLTSAIMASITPDKITKIIAFSFGSISGGEDRERSITQHVLLLTIKDTLKNMIAHADVEIRCYVQDPEYSDVDRTALAGAGIEVLDDPQGFLEVDDSSVVLSFDSAVPVRQIVADLARPAIMIWNKVRSEEEVIQCSAGGGESPICKSLEGIEGGLCDPKSSRLRQMVQNEYVVIAELDGDNFPESCVYARRSSLTGKKG